ncbi:hypothetical protein [Arthrobacter cupressi]|uniref:Uncharacterized protein n=1 Tax=Arthrobacter cupressi TaxID=1045773 RepID=A0A1G8VFT3_9MICC|nr:hypothetical protein [Arthrobacter cupressi]NYD79440.1 hypothetical protein [Arthrobacter cupressi]SDJ64898.1 hypothetical protein SAMN05216555_11413 [Arthrobacter cupressi]
MDRIEQLMKDAKPRVGEPGITPGAVEARSIVFSTDPEVVSLAGRTPRRRAAMRTAVAGLAAAAAVAAAVVVGGTLMPQPAPDPANTGTPSISASPTPSHSPSPTATTQPAGLSTNGVACTPANIDLRRSTQNPATEAIPAAEQKYYKVLGCADGWLAYELSAEGARVIGGDGGDAWYNIARLQDNKRFLTDFQQPWSSVYSWKFQALNNDVSQNGQHLTPQQAMDKEFADKGIPVDIRPQLVGDGPPTTTGATPGLSAYTSPDGRVTFDYPQQWTVRAKESSAPGEIRLTVHDAEGKKLAELVYGSQGGGLGGGCATPVPYTVLDYAEVSLPYNKAFEGVITPRFAYRAMETNGRVLASYGLTSTVGGADGKACSIYNVVNGPAESPSYMFASGAQMRADFSDAEAQAQGVMTFATMDEAINYRNSEEYRLLKAMITSLKIPNAPVD